ncbi:MAG: hypothetical protein ABGX05_09575 [Pirellulaceae bacterium]
MPRGHCKQNKEVFSVEKGCDSKDRDQFGDSAAADHAAGRLAIRVFLNDRRIRTAWMPGRHSFRSFSGRITNNQDNAEQDYQRR